MNSPDKDIALMGFTACIVGALLGETKVAPAELPGLVTAVRASLAGSLEAMAAAAVPPTLPANVTIESSVQPDHLVSLITGGKFQSLKRHLATHGMTPASYRERFGLPPDYPMVAANYSAQRTQLAKAQGLGANRKAVQATADAAMGALAKSAGAKAKGGTTGTKGRTTDSVRQTETEGRPAAKSRRALAAA